MPVNCAAPAKPCGKQARSRSGIATAESARLLIAAPTGIAKAHRREVSSGRGIRRRRQYGGERTPSASVRSKEVLRDSAVGGKLF